MKKNNGDKSSSEILRQKVEELLKEKSEAKILELIEELAYQNEEKAKRADELLIANKELVFQIEEKAKRADELLIANKELAFQNEEKIKRAAELIVAKKEITVQAELIIANSKALKIAHELEISQIKLEKQNLELKQSEQRYQALVEWSPYAVIVHRNLKIVYANSAAIIMFGATGAEDLVGTNIMDRVHPDSHQIVLERILSGTDDAINTVKAELKYFKLDGTIIIAEVQGTPITYDGVACILASMSNISGRKEIEEQLKQTSARLALATRAGGVGIWDLDIFKNSLSWDDQMFTLYGVEKKDFLGVYEAWQSVLHPDDRTQCEVEYNMAIRGEKELDNEFRVVWPDGTVHHIRAIAAVMRDNSGKPLNMNGTNWDITEQKQKEEALQQARSEAIRANVAKSEFLSRMSHELRTPMNSILGFAQLMEMGELKELHKKWIVNIRNSGKHLLSLINEVLELAGIESGRQILTPQAVGISAILYEISEVVQILADKRNVSIEIIDSPGNKLFVFADKLRLNQVLLNLTSNAIKYNREGGSVTIKTALQPTDTDGNTQIRISISDTGNGIKPEDITKLFQPFERIGADKTKTEGTGLGLVVVKELIKAMNGAVGVESEVGVGSTFWIELPLTENMKTDKQQNEENITLTADSVIANIEPGFKNENELLVRSAGHEKTGTILYIEDNASNTELVEQILLNHRPAIHLVSHTNGAQAVSLAIKYAPDLILLDLDLPDIPGFEVIKLLQAVEKTKKIPVVVISADAMPHQIEKLMEAGSKDYLIKPLDIMAFWDVVDKWMGNFPNVK